MAIAKKYGKRRLIALFCIMGLQVLASSAGAIENGEVAPKLNIQNATGQRLHVPVGKQIVYVDFWASWCGPCKQSFPWMSEMHKKYGHKGLQIVAINLDKQPGAAQKFLKAYPAKFTIGYDANGETPTAFGVKVLPTSYLLDKKGKVIYQHAGFFPGDEVGLEDRILQALSE